jgi:hypothetical protein
MAERDIELAKLKEVAREQQARDKEAADRAAKDAKKEAQDRATLARNQMKEMIEDYRKAQEAMRKAEKDADNERRQAAVAGIGESQTALGSFKFDAYPAAAKKQNDERIVRALEDMRAQQKIGGFI